MHALQLTELGQFAQITTDRVFRRSELAGQFFGNDVAVFAQPSQDESLSLRSQHELGQRLRRIALSSMLARNCTIIHELAMRNLPLSDTPKPMLVLIVGPYLSGTGGDHAKIAANTARLESFALPVFERGHLPLVSEWMALPIIQAAGGRIPGDAVFDKYQYPVAHRLLERCDAVLRIAGESRGADLDVARARELGLPIFSNVNELPRREAEAVESGA